MKKKIYFSICLNVLISILVLLSTIFMFVGFRFMNGDEIILESTSLEVFKYFTVQSNIFMGIIAFIFVLKELKLLKGKFKKIEEKYYVWKLVSTTAVGLTLFVVFVYFGPIAKNGLASMLMNSNLFFHLIIPVLSIINFILFENNNNINKKSILYCIVPTILYGCYYLVNILIHMENGMVSPKYDFYWFVQNGVWTSIIVIPIILLITYLIGLLLWFFNKRMSK